jgi:hypothetical protein
MKKTIFMLAAATVLLVVSCKGNTEKVEGEAVETTTTVEEPAVKEEPASVVGVWKMTDITLDMEIPKGQEKAFADMKKKMVDATVYTFNDDGTMSFKNNLVKETKGTYVYADGKITIENSTTKQKESVTVDELTADKLVITSQQGGRKATMSFAK